MNERQVDAAGERQRFTSQISPPNLRRSPKVGEVMPILYLRRHSKGDFRDALPVLFGADTPGLSPANIARLTTCWEAEYLAFAQRSLAECDYVYVCADGIYLA